MRTSLSPCTVKCFLRDALSLNIFPQDSRWQENVLYWVCLMFFYPSVKPPLTFSAPPSPAPTPSLWMGLLLPFIFLVGRDPGLRPPAKDGSLEIPLPLWRFFKMPPNLLRRFLDPNMPPDRTKFKLIFIVMAAAYERWVLHCRVFPPNPFEPPLIAV